MREATVKAKEGSSRVKLQSQVSVVSLHASWYHTYRLRPIVYAIMPSSFLLALLSSYGIYWHLVLCPQAMSHGINHHHILSCLQALTHKAEEEERAATRRNKRDITLAKRQQAMLDQVMR